MAVDVKIDMNSIMNKVNTFIGSSTFQSKAAAATKAEADAKASAICSDLVACVESAIGSSGLSGGAIAAIGGVSASVTDLGNGEYHIEATIGQESRPSLCPEKYPDGATDMAGLFDKGYSAGGVVYGEWHGNRIRSLPHRPGVGFVAHAVAEFQGKHGADDGVVSVDYDHGRFQ